MLNSIIFNTDSYKVSMWKQYPEGTRFVYSYISARGGIYDATVVMGLRSFVNDVLSKPVTKEDVELGKLYWEVHGEPFNYDGWMYIVNELNGYLPLQVRAIPEGSVVPTGNPLVTIVNTDPKCFWLTTWVETAALRAVWYPSSVATVSFEIKKVIRKYLEISGTPSDIAFKLHDFGARGTSSLESASLGGMAHLVNFMGTDTYSGIVRVMQDYGDAPDTIGFSIPAAEHSTITSWGKEFESKAFANMVDKFAGPGKIYAVVSDSYDIFEACRKWGFEPLKSKVINSGGTLVIRPDSGDPVQVLLKCVGILGSTYGFTINEKGFKVLNNVRLIWGDGINKDTITQIYSILVDQYSWSADNFAFGMGGALLNKIQRDDLGWAMKCSAIGLGYESDTWIKWLPVFKDPVTAPGKASLKGCVTTYLRNGEYSTGVTDWETDALVDYYFNGTDEYPVFTEPFSAVRARAEAAL